ncbi:hypothetical protein G6F61_009607 [Rhizopus arrhizus]|nr:hypothetical protein G6F61_009607 [Rhizopus arrhizus]
MEEIQWWKKFVTIKNGFPVHRIHLTNPKTSAYVDASDTGWGVASTSSSLQDFGRWKTNSNRSSLQQTHNTSIVQAYTWSNKHNSRQTQQENDPAVRGSITKQNISNNSKEMGTINDQCIHNESQQEIEYILEPTPRSGSFSTRCFQPTMAYDRSLPQSILETDIKSLTINETSKDKESSIDYTVLAHSIQVPDADEDETTTETNVFPSEEMGNDRLTSLNDLRSAMASVYKIIHPQNPALANQQLITAFFKAKRRLEIRIPSVQQLETWDLDIMTSYYGTNKIRFRKTPTPRILNTECYLTFSRTKRSTERSAPNRDTLPKDHTAFLAYIDDPAKVKTASPTTVENWGKYHMENADIDTSVYKAHSVQSASCTKAVQNGHSIQSIKQHAN